MGVEVCTVISTTVISFFPLATVKEKVQGEEAGLLNFFTCPVRSGSLLIYVLLRDLMKRTMIVLPVPLQLMLMLVGYIYVIYSSGDQ